MRKSYSQLKIAIIHVEADVVSILERAKKRSLVTGRVVPESLILKSLHEISHSLHVLIPETDFYANILNEDDVDPILIHCEMHMKGEHPHHKRHHHKRLPGNKDEGKTVDHPKEIDTDEWILDKKDKEIVPPLSTIAIDEDENKKKSEEPEPIPYILTTIKRKKADPNDVPIEAEKQANEEKAAAEEEEHKKKLNLHTTNATEELQAKKPYSLAELVLSDDRDKKLRHDGHHHHEHHKSHHALNVIQKERKAELEAAAAAAAQAKKLSGPVIEIGPDGTIIEKTIKEVDDWYFYFHKVWSMRCALSRPLSKLKRLPTIRDAGGTSALKLDELIEEEGKEAQNETTVTVGHSKDDHEKGKNDKKKDKNGIPEHYDVDGTNDSWLCASWSTLRESMSGDNGGSNNWWSWVCSDASINPETVYVPDEKYKLNSNIEH